MDKNLLKITTILCSVFIAGTASAETYTGGPNDVVRVSVDNEGTYVQGPRGGSVQTDTAGHKTITGTRDNSIHISPGESVTVSDDKHDATNSVTVSKNEDGGATITKNNTTTTITPNEDGSITATGPDGTATKNGDTTTVTTGHGETSKTITFDNTKKPSRPRPRRS